MSEKTTLPNLLNDIVDFLKKRNLQLSNQSRDGRINSAFNEDEIFRLLESKFTINHPNMPDWVDFSFYENNVFYPVNIKVSTTKTTDNLNCKLGIYYALTGKIPPFNNGVSWEIYFKTLSENLEPNSKDYYFLIINKDNPSDVFATSLKSLESILPNGNNLPFQAKWDNNRQLIHRDFKSAKAFLLGTFEESLKLRADAYLHFRTHFNDCHNLFQSCLQNTTLSLPYDFYIQCDFCNCKNHCCIDSTRNGKITIHYRHNKQ